MKNLLNRYACLVLAVIGLAACAGTPRDEGQVVSYIRLSPSPPPVSPYEEKLPAENPMQEVWRKGYWDYDGKQFTWVEGHYITRPDPTAIWTPDRWEQRAFGWAFIPGYWQ